eukprot:9232459-Pyramimonas_sp.AAC.1
MELPPVAPFPPAVLCTARPEYVLQGPLLILHKLWETACPPGVFRLLELLWRRGLVSARQPALRTSSCLGRSPLEV